MQDTEEAKIGPRRQKAPRMRSRKKKKKETVRLPAVSEHKNLYFCRRIWE